MHALAKNAFIRVIGGSVPGAFGRLLSGRRLRVLAYHGLEDPASFRSQMEHLLLHYKPISGSDVVRAARGETALPSNSVWVTFDDGSPTVTRHAQPILDRLGIPATLFVCPGLVDSDIPFWWEVVEAAVARGEPGVFGDGEVLTGPSLLNRLKTVSDTERRRVVDQLRRTVESREEAPLRGHQLRTEDLRPWVQGGHEIGNHTWDHPCLDRCDPAEQRRQLQRADDWLRSRFPEQPPVFAYPNGNWTPGVELELRSLDYEVAVGFDHRLASLSRPSTRISRLRVSADASLPRFSSIVSGLHPTVYALGTRASQSRTRDPRRLV